MRDKEKTTARSCSCLLRESPSLRGALAEGFHCVSAEHKQSFFIKDKYSINDCYAGFNIFLFSFPFLFSGRRKTIESENI